MAMVLAFLKAMLAPVLAKVAANWLSVAIKSTPLLVLLITFGVEYKTGDTWDMLRTIAIVASAGVLGFDIAGKITIKS